MKCVCYFVFAISVALFCSLLSAQSNFDLSPPVQAETKSDEVLMSPDPSALPTFDFAVAELNEEGKIVISTKTATQKLIAGQEATPDLSKGIPYTEQVAQEFTVMIPQIRNDKDGKAVTVMIPAARTRMVAVTKYRKRNKEEQIEYERELELQENETKDQKIKPAKEVAVEIPYTVTIPFNETKSDGTTIMRTKTVTRMRIAQVMRGDTETTPLVETSVYDLDKIKCFSVAGEFVAPKKVKKMMGEKRPVILINHEKAIAPYFETILKPETLFIVCDDK